MSKYTDDVEEALSIVNPYQMSRRYKCPLISFDTQHAHSFNTSDHRATVRFLVDGEWYRKIVRVRRRDVVGLKASRQAHLESAIEYAKKRGLNVEEWVPTGFRDSWMPKDVRDRMREELKQWRKEQRAAEKSKDQPE